MGCSALHKPRRRLARCPHALTLPLQVEQDGKSVSMRFTLTPDLIAMVFAEKPHVKRSFDKNVPANMSEKEFWTRYLKHELAKEVRRARVGRVG